VGAAVGRRRRCRRQPLSASVFGVGDDAEGLVVVVGVVPDVGVVLGAAADDDAPFAAVVQARGVDGVFAVVVAAFAGQEAFVVAEVLAVVGGVDVVLVGEDAVDDVVGLRRQHVHGAGVRQRGDVVLVGDRALGRGAAGGPIARRVTGRVAG